MAFFGTRPDESFPGFTGNEYWDITPIAVGGPIYHYTRIDEWLGSPNVNDYWRKLIGITEPVGREIIGFMNNNPVGLVTSDSLSLLTYMKSTKVIDDPGIQFDVYYNTVTIPSAASGTNTTDIYSTTSEFSGSVVGDLFKNITRNMSSRIQTVHDSNHITINGYIFGQTVGDNIELMTLQVSKSFGFDTLGLWTTLEFHLGLSPTATQLNEMRMLVRSSTGGDYVPEFH